MHVKMSTNKMAIGKSIRMYLTIFIATTCIYMVLYQYHLNRAPMPVPEVIKTRQKPSSYASFLWSPMSILTAKPNAEEEAAEQQQKAQHKNVRGVRQEQQEQEQEHEEEAMELVKESQLSLSATISAPLNASSSSSSSSSSLPPSLSYTLTGKAVVNDTTLLQQHIGQNHTITSITSTTTITSSTSSSGTSSTITTTAAAAANAKPITTIQNQIPTTTTNNRKLLASSASSASYTSSSLPSSSSSSSSSANVKNGHKHSAVFTPVSIPPPLYIITPTYRRPEQLAELTRLGYTLKHVANLLWLVIEDANKTSTLVTQTLNRVGVPYEYLVAPMPEQYKKAKKVKPRGVSNRNRGMEWLRANATEGVFYFADDDNTYDISIFEQMRYTKKVSMWPVGLVTKFGVSSPIVRNGKIDGYYDGWIGGRKFPVDMAGFAVSVKFLHERPHAVMPFKPGYEEDGFLKSLAPLNNTEIELLASACTEILTWHTQTKKNEPAIALNMTKYGDTNLVSISQHLVRP